MKCLYCEKEINKFSLKSLLYKEDLLCSECRRQLLLERKIIKINELKIIGFYKYDSLFKSLLIQYKECYDEALKDVFLYDLYDYLKIKYHGYKILYVPSTKEKIKQRGFNHLEEIFKVLGFKEVKGLKTKQEISQKGKNKRERESMIDNYEYIGEDLDKVLIVDDVITTGSSIYGVYKAIKNKANKIEAICLSYQK